MAENIVIHSIWKYINKTKYMRKVRRYICHCAELSKHEFVRWSGGIVPSILNHASGCRWMFNGNVLYREVVLDSVEKRKVYAPIGIEPKTPRSFSPYVSLHSSSDWSLWTPPEVCTTRKRSERGTPFRIFDSFSDMNQVALQILTFAEMMMLLNVSSLWPALNYIS